MENKITEYKTRDGEVFQQVQIGYGSISPQFATGKQPNFRGNLKLKGVPVAVAGWWKKDEQGNNAWISLVVNFKTKKQADIPLELIDAEVLEAFGLPSDFNEKMKEVE